MADSRRVGLAGAERRASRGSDSAYRPLDFVVVRAPLLPIECYASLSNGDRNVHDPRDLLASLPRAHEARLALAVASESLQQALDRPGPAARGSVHLNSKLLRFLIRMSTRPTPFGLFAGVGLGSWSPRTDLRIGAGLQPKRLRPDMAWLLRLVNDLESRPEIRRSLNFVANSGVMLRSGRAFLGERAACETSEPEASVSIRATSAVRRALAVARRFTAFEEIILDVLVVPGATREKAEQLLTELWQQTLLISDLRPPLTTDDPARYVLDRMASLPGVDRERAALGELLDEADSWGRMAAAPASRAYPEIVASAEGVVPTHTGPVFQVDLGLTLEARSVGHPVAEEAARAAELLLRLSPLPRGPGHLETYRRAFEARYGPHREVPLTEVLDPDFGIGPLSGYRPGSTAARADDAVRAARRGSVLLDLAVGSARSGASVVHLQERTISDLQTWSTSSIAPATLDLSVLVAAASRESIDRGDFRLVVGPNLGAMEAGRTLGRFADLLGADGRAALGSAGRALERSGPECIWAELVYMPRRVRLANVTVRPPIRRHEIAWAVTPSVDSSHVIPLDELLVGVRDDRLMVRWSRDGAEVKVTSGHMLNWNNAPEACRFLSEVGRDGVAQLAGFDWGPASASPFLPRVQVGRVVLSLARWRIDASARDGALPAASEARFVAAFADWRRAWHVPRHVFLSQGDNRLLLDLECPDQTDELRKEILHLREAAQIYLQESLPGIDECWALGPDGHFLTELVVPLVASSILAGATESAGRAGRSETGDAPPTMHELSSYSRTDRLRPPGSDWLFMKLYCPRHLQDDLIAGPIRTFAERAVADGLAARWFFLRYSDPDSHVRIRFSGQEVTITDQLTRAACEWAKELVAGDLCHRFCLDTYDRELERFGGVDGTELAESMFFADSRAVADILQLIASRELALDPVAAAVLSADNLLAGLGLSAQETHQWLGAQRLPRQEVGPEFRVLKGELRSLLGDSGRLRARAGGAPLQDTLSAARGTIGELAERLIALQNAGRLRASPRTLFRSYLHLHCNRLLGGEVDKEQRVLALLLRTRESLANAPYRPSTS